MNSALSLVRTSAIALAALSCIAVAGAESGTRDLAGQWRFETETIANKGCAISGEITFTALPDTSAFSCAFVSREDCGSGDSARYQTVQQACTARFVNDTLSIKSEVVSIIDAGPAYAREGLMDPRAYAADNFLLQPKSDSEMEGIFHSLNRAGVRFWRVEELLS